MYDSTDSVRPDERRPIIYQTGGLGAIVTIANTLFAVVIITALIRNQTSAAVAIVAGGCYYAVTTHTALLILSGALTTITQQRAEQITQRRLYELQYTVQRPAVDPLPALPGDDTPQLSAPPNLPALPSYVPAREQDDSVRRSAVAWVLQLFDADGDLDPKKVILNTQKERPGRINVALPSAAAKQYLLDSRIIYPMPHGYRYNLRYPTVADVKAALVQPTPVGR